MPKQQRANETFLLELHNNRHRLIPPLRVILERSENRRPMRPKAPKKKRGKR